MQPPPCRFSKSWGVVFSPRTTKKAMYIWVKILFKEMPVRERKVPLCREFRPVGSSPGSSVSPPSRPGRWPRRRSSSRPLPARSGWSITVWPGCGDLEAGLAQIGIGGLTIVQLGQGRHPTPWPFMPRAPPGMPTAVLVHGYGTDADWAVRHGNSFRSLIEQQACGRPFRLIVWSWPADREPVGFRRHPEQVLP